MRVYTTTPIAERFWAKVDTSGDCWVWTASKSAFGYGKLKRARPDTRWIAAHRFSWTLTYGPIPPGLSVLHRCDNPPCVRPDHLWLGTHADNDLDRDRKGRTARGDRLLSTKIVHRGEEVRTALLRDAQVLEIRRRFAEGGITQRALGKVYGVPFQTIYRVVRRKTWRHLP